jgi:hypothetical protein
MKFTRRGLLGTLLAAAVPVAAVAAPEPPLKQRFPKGAILPRQHMAPDYSNAGHTHSYTPAVVLVDYLIFDGEQFVPFNSVEGQRVVLDLRRAAGQPPPR